MWDDNDVIHEPADALDLDLDDVAGFGRIRGRRDQGRARQEPSAYRQWISGVKHA
jgi:hypothetical protein